MFNRVSEKWPGVCLPAGRRVVGLGQHREHHVERGHPHPEVEDDVAVVGSDPVVLRLERPGGADLGRLVAGAGEDEGRPSLAVEDLAADVDLPA